MFSLDSLNSVTKNIFVNNFEPATSCLRGQDAAIAPARQETGDILLIEKMNT